MVSACGGGGGGGGSDGGGGGGSDAASKPLSCSSLAWCTNYTVHNYVGSYPGATGGSIMNGTYRLAYEISGGGGGSSSDHGFVISGHQVVGIGSTGDGVGVLTTSGNTLTIRSTEACDRTGRSIGPREPNIVIEYLYTATSNEIRLFRTFNSGEAVYVYRLVSGSFCDPVPSEPATPEDSYLCRETNCKCAEAKEAVLSPQACTF